MNHDEAQREIKRLSDEIRRCDRLYYVEATPDVPDHEYDFMMKRLQALETEFPDLALPTSPTQRIGDKIDGKAEVVKHREPMLSIANVYDDDELREFVDSAQKNFDKPLAWVCELKIDGVAATIIYENRELKRALTRGDGQYGEDITANVRTIRDVPLLLPDSAPDFLEARGEIYMTNETLERVNEEARKEALEAGREFKPYANTRNLTAGTIKQLDPSVCAKRRLQFFAHSIGADPRAVAPTHYEFMQKLRSFGFATAPHLKRAENFEEARKYVDVMREFIPELDFEVDGIVLKVDDFDAREKIGSTSKYPKWIVACKFEKYEAPTKVRDIVVQVGKSGVITPVAELEPVEIAGTIVSRASLHNIDEIERKDVRVGDVVIVEKAGKIIPHVSRVETYLRDEKNPPKPYVFPKTCPSCGSPLKRDEVVVGCREKECPAGIVAINDKEELEKDGKRSRRSVVHCYAPECPAWIAKTKEEHKGAHIRCRAPECPAQFRERLAFFASKEAMDVNGLADALVEKLTSPRPAASLLEAERPPLVETFADLYRLTVADLLTLDGYKERSAQKIVDAIQESKSRGPARLLNALSISGVGASTARDVVAVFRSFDAMENSSPKDFEKVEGVGKIIARNIYDFFHSEAGVKIVAELKALGLETATPEESPEERAAKPLEGKVICATGTMRNYDRQGIKAAIMRAGAKATSSVSKKTDYLLVGEAPGQVKVDKANELGVHMISEEEFEAMIAAAPAETSANESDSDSDAPKSLF